jgi:hypothetical protein
MGSVHIRAGRVRLRVGDPIPVNRLALGDRVELTRRLYNEISRLLEAPAPKT